MLRLVVTVAALVLAVASPAAARDQPPQGEAPPGSAAVDQYRESVPQAPSTKRVPVSKSQRRALDQAAGGDGRALADALDRAGGVAGGGGSPAKDGSSGGGSTGAGSTGSGSGSGAGEMTAARPDRRLDAPDSRAQTTAASALGTQLGPLPIWLLLVVITVAAVGGAVVRRRGA